MAKKRMTDTEIWTKEWFMDLSPKHKCLIRYLFDNCDAAGVWKPNWKLASMQIGEQVSEADLKQLPSDQYEIMDGKIFLPDFISFQYGKLSENSPAHKPVFTAIKKHNLSDRVLGRISNTLQEKETDKDKDKEKEKDSEEADQTLLENGTLISQMFSVWHQENPSYRHVQNDDFTALRKIAEFLSGRKGIEHLNTEQRTNLMETWGKWCRYIKDSIFRNESLLTIGKFKLQRIHNEVSSIENDLRTHSGRRMVI